jgi:hypothetical protein
MRADPGRHGRGASVGHSASGGEAGEQWTRCIAVSLYRCIIGEPPSVEAWQYLTDLRLTDRVSPDVETLRAEPSSRLFMSGKLWSCNARAISVTPATG